MRQLAVGGHARSNPIRADHAGKTVGSLCRRRMADATPLTSYITTHSSYFRDWRLAVAWRCRADGTGHSSSGSKGGGRERGSREEETEVDVGARTRGVRQRGARERRTETTDHRPFVDPGGRRVAGGSAHTTHHRTPHHHTTQKKLKLSTPEAQPLAVMGRSGPCLLK